MSLNVFEKQVEKQITMNKSIKVNFLKYVHIIFKVTFCADLNVIECVVILNFLLIYKDHKHLMYHFVCSRHMSVLQKRPYVIVHAKQNKSHGLHFVILISYLEP